MANGASSASQSYSQTGKWSSSSGGFSGTYSVAAGGSDSTATWLTVITAADQGPSNGFADGIEVSATWTPNASNATNATYSIYDGTSTSGTLLGTVAVDQTQAPVGIAEGGYVFQDLGDFFPSSGTLTVVLNAGSANGDVVADAVGLAPCWASSGGPSQYETEPAYQEGVQSTGFRTLPDVAFDADFNSGVWCYDSYNYPSDPLGEPYGGTSLGSPCWAGLIAIANQGRVAAKEKVFNSGNDPTQILQAIYSLPSSDFHDITSGYNGYSAGPGYDFVTGRGTPLANELIPGLMRYGASPSFDNTTAAVPAQQDIFFPVYPGSDALNPLDNDPVASPSAPEQSVQNGQVQDSVMLVLMQMNEVQECLSFRVPSSEFRV